MLRNYAVIRQSAARAGQAAIGAHGSLVANHVQQEPAMTDRMLGRIEEAMNGFTVKGIKWSAMTLTDRGPGSQESKYGADFLGVLEISLPGFKVKKGFLAQAKRIEPRTYMSNSDFDKMVSQCKKMLRVSPDSFVFLYSSIGISVVPAISVIGLDSPTNPHELYTRGVTRFLEEHFESFIGDGNLWAASITRLEELTALADSIDARSALSLKAESAGRPLPFTKDRT